MVLAALVIVGVAWALWPATKWPGAFCAPVVRVVSVDVNPLAISLAQPTRLPSANEIRMVARLRTDVRRALAAAPTSLLQRELSHYLFLLRSSRTSAGVSYAFSQFDQEARTQLRACGVTPSGR